MKREAVALVDEARCIGCTRCIDACPVDAIVGAQSLMHTVVEAWCIGCELCLPPCPVDCIEMVPARAAWTAALKADAKGRAAARKARLRKQVVFPQRNRQAIVAEVLARRKR
jgi:electron transport complex protein RnfB